jgi:hypothetical protein
MGLPLLGGLGAGMAIAVLAPAACAHPDHAEIETSSGGGDAPCVLESAASTGDEAIAGTWQWRMAPGVATEIDVDLGTGGFMAATFESPGAPLQWDIHSHEGDDVIVHDGGEDVSGFADFVAPAPGIYSFYFRNPGPSDATLCVELQLAGEAALHPR